MDAEVRIAPDRRGEVAVGRAREPRVADVPGRIDGLLERAKHERGQCAAALVAGAQILEQPGADRSDELPCLAGRDALGDGRSRYLEAFELGDEELDRIRVGLLVDPVNGGTAGVLQGER